jgi:hypothetical protein
MNNQITRLFYFLILLGSCKTVETKYSCPCDEGNAPVTVLNDGKYMEFETQVGRLVKIEGYYSFSFEESAIYQDYTSLKKSDRGKAVWVTFDGSCLLNQDIARKLLIQSPDELKKITGKKITVWGILDYGNTGHLNQYKAAITKICFFRYEE